MGFTKVAKKRNSLFTTPRLPLLVRLLFPVVTLACVVLVTVSNMLTIASVIVVVEVGEDVKLEPGSLLDFSLGQTVHDM